MLREIGVRNIEIDGEKIDAKDFEINWNGKPEKVTIKTLNFGEYTEIMQQSLRIKSAGRRQPQVDTDVGILRISVLLKGLHQAPFPHKTIEDIKKIRPFLLAEEIYNEIEKLNSLDEEIKKK